jgi:hypothetical protein
MLCHKKRENMWSELNLTLSAANTLILNCLAMYFALSVARGTSSFMGYKTKKNGIGRILYSWT